jgi:hypothetical protein
MRRLHGKRSRFFGLLVAAIGTVAMLALPGIAAAKDRNHDRIPDRWEKRHHLSTSVNQASRDQDGDHLRNRGEFRAGDNPRDQDSDDDGVIDGDENAGTIVSFDAATGKLTIALFNGETISGLVTDATRIQCGHECNHGDDSKATVSDHGDGDHSGSGSGPPGQGDDENDDPPGDDGTAPGASEGPGHGADNTPNCTTAALTEGTVVEEAELELEHGVASFEKVELGG